MLDLQALIGVVGGPVAVALLTDHLKRAAACLPWTRDRSNATTWPLVADLVGVLWGLALWKGGLLAEMVPGVEWTWPIVILASLVVFGLGSSAIVDGKRALRPPAEPQP